MKKIVLIRHAKSSWGNSGSDDFSRPLNQKGIEESKTISRALTEKIAKPDIILTSSAHRALSTARYFASAFSYPEESIIKDKTLYLASRQEILKTISRIDPKHSLVFLIGHNPTITEFACYLCNASIASLPTCSAIGIEFETDAWDLISNSKAKILFLEYPKENIFF